MKKTFIILNNIKFKNF